MNQQVAPTVVQEPKALLFHAPGADLDDLRAALAAE